MTSFFIHLSFFLFFFLFFLFFLFFSFYISILNLNFFGSIQIFNFWFMDLSLSFYMDFMSIWFSTVILLISSIIMIYSYSYMSPYFKSIYFLWLTSFFVISMLFVVCCSDLFFLMLGWDGLGLISFFLIVFYQNQLSITSGLFTLLMNRIGDSIFICSIALMFLTCSNTTFFSSFNYYNIICFFLVFTFMTKSAIFPFSPWLPAAMAAPTPISALVHSSTLVASGLFLMMRFNYMIYYSYNLTYILMILSIFTSFYAGLNTLFEKDMKKLIALSTLSHLGFISLAFSCGFLYLAFFHMVSHALFKSLLFMTMGDIMHYSNHSQDIRFLPTGIFYTPSSCFVMFVCLFNLLGLPSLSGFFSKDLVLEMSNFSNMSTFLFFMFFFNIFFTYNYTYNLFFYSFQFNKFFSFNSTHNSFFFHTMLLNMMSFMTLISGKFFIFLIFKTILFVTIPFYLKIFPLFLVFVVFMYLYMNKKMFSFFSKYFTFYFSNMMYLTIFFTSFSSFIYFKNSFFLIKSCEDGVFNFILNTHLNSFFYVLSNMILSMSLKMMFSSVFFSFLLFLFIVVI